MSEDAPKSAYELAMERLRKKDADAGVVEQKLTDGQKAAIAEARSIYEARMAELQILQRDQRFTVRDAAQLVAMDEEYRRDMERFASERDARIKKIREEGAK
jgi:erythromycin esterase-like protein